MIRKINYTGRKKINKSNIDLKLSNDNGKRTFNIHFDLGDLGFPDSSSIYVEPYYKSSFMRFYFGTIGKPIIPTDRNINDLPVSDVVLFRVKVVDESGIHGRLLGLADKLRPRDEKEIEKKKKSILWVDYQDLDEEIWRVSFSNSMPVLEINKRIKNGNELLKSSNFFALVYPSVIRQILKRMVMDDIQYDGDGDEWQNLWMKYFKNVLKTGDMPEFKDENMKSEWVEEVVAAFCRRNMTRSKLEL